MKINLKGANIELAEQVRSYLDKRLSAIGKIIDPSEPTLMIDVELSRTTKHHQTGDIFRSEINLHYVGGDFRVVSEAADLNAAIDQSKDRLISELGERKKKQLSFLRRSGQKIKNIIKEFD